MMNDIEAQHDGVRGLSHGISWILVLAFTLGLSISVADAAKMPDEDRIKSDLVGQHLRSGGLKWRFDSVSELHEFDIKTKRVNGVYLEYKISVVLKAKSGPKGAADLVVVYKREKAGWRFVTVTDNNTLRQIR